MAQRSRGYARGHSNTTTAVRGAGIRKRSPQPPRMERDGDLIMDGAGDSRGRPRGGNRGPYQSNRGGPSRNTINTNALSRAISSGDRNNNMILREGSRNNPIRSQRANHRKPERSAWDELTVRGWKQSAAVDNEDHGISKLITFINKKASRNDSDILVQQSQERGDDLHIWVKPEDTQKVLRINNFLFARATLDIRVIREAKEAANNTSDLKSKLQSIINRCYKADDKHLNLSQLSNDEMTTPEMFESEERVSKLFAALMKICEEKWASQNERRNAVHSLSLANNGLSNVKPITTVALTFANIKNLDLSGNNLSTLKALEAWSRKYRHLEHLILRGNPVENIADFHVQLMKWYPKLRIIDTVQVRSEDDIAREAHRGLPIRPGSFQDEASIGENFLKQFFPLWDSDRMSIINKFYCAKSVFSINVISKPADRQPDNDSASLTPWIKKSRNFKRVTSSHGRDARIFEGREPIMNAIKDLPSTRHPDLVHERQKWLLECRRVEGLPDYANNNPAGVNGLIITVHGQFEDRQDTTNGVRTATRSFNRSFTLGPGEAPGIVYIYNDCLFVRPFKNYPAFNQTVTPQQSPQLQVPQLAVPTAIEIPQGLVAPQGWGFAAADKIPEQVKKEILALELSKITRMTLNYSIMCLEESQYNLEVAIKKFEDTKEILPMAAFW